MSKWKQINSITGAEEVDVSGGDVTLRSVSRSIYVGTAGDLVVELVDGDQVTYKSGQQHHDICAVKVIQTGTTATDIIAEY